LANPLLIIGAGVAAFALLRKKDDEGSNNPPGNTAPPDPDKMTSADLKATEPLERAKGDTSLEIVDAIVELIGVKKDLDFCYPYDTRVAIAQNETFHDNFHRRASLYFKEAYGVDFYEPTANPLNSDNPKTNFTACNGYYLVLDKITIEGRILETGSVLHESNKDVLLALKSAEKNKLFYFHPDKEWERIFEDVVNYCIDDYIKADVNVAARLLMFCILCAESFGIVAIASARFDLSGFKVLACCKKRRPQDAAWLYKQYVRYMGVVRFATFNSYITSREKSSAKASQAVQDAFKNDMRQMFSCFDSGDYTANPLLKPLKDELSRSWSL